MRDIKFRGLSVNGEWYYGLLAKTESKKIACGDIGSFISNSAGCAFAFQVRPETVGQFTGLLDKNGKEIYEGDIVKIGDIEIIEIKDIRFLEKLFLAENIFISVEVIGNIFEDSHLLENNN